MGAIEFQEKMLSRFAGLYERASEKIFVNENPHVKKLNFVILHNNESNIRVK